MSDSPNAKLVLVEQSPARVAEHDKAGWLALFTDDATIIDPIGGPTHQGAEARSRFWDTFIAPNDIRFEVFADIIAPSETMETEVVRDIHIHVRSAAGAEIVVPTYLRYVVREEAAGLKIRTLEAYWELGGQMKQMTANGLRGVRTSMGITAGMLRNQGMGFLWSYSRGMLGIGNAGHKAVVRLANALTQRDESVLTKLVADGATLEHPVGGRDGQGNLRTPLTAQSVLATLPLDAVVRIEQPISAGRFTGFRYAIDSATQPSHGIGFCRFVPARTQLAELRLFRV
jgi:ketosteroid isomerase-like protein